MQTLYSLYPVIKLIHFSCVVFSISFFCCRGVGMLYDASWLKLKVVKILPHIVDTCLLLSAMTLAFILQQYPIAQPWLTAKLIGLVCYIGFGMLALKRGKTKTIRATAFILAICSACYILSVAITRNPLPWV